MKDFSEDRNPVEALAEDYLERHRSGDKPELSEYTEKYPELAEEIEDLFPALLMMEDIRPDSGDATGTFNTSGSDDGPKLEQIGDYRILQEVGRGGMGVVYEAIHESLGRRVALKVLPQHATMDHKQLRRFDREVKSAARLHHTNIVPIFGVGHEDGIHYYVMQFIQGLGLDEVLHELKQLNSGSMSDGSFPTAKTSGERLSFSYEEQTKRYDISAVMVAKSLMTGQFEQTMIDPLETDSDWNQPSLENTLDYVEPDDMDATEISSRESSPEKQPASGLSETLSLSSASLSSTSLSLPGLSETPESRSTKKQTYWQGVANIGTQVGYALQYAHEQGVLHRDIKPANLLLDARGTVWVTDFGLAKADDQQDITHTGDIIGTLRYMAPEAFEGRTDVRSEVYSLGLTLYELLALEPAFNQRDRNSLIKQVTSEPPPRLEKVNPEIPRDLVTIIHKAIDRDPTHRYQSTGELADDLQRFLDDEPIHARRISLPERFVRWARRNKTIATMASAIAVLLVVTAIGSSLAAIQFEKIAETNKQLASDSNVQKVKAEALTKVANAERQLAVEQTDIAIKAQATIQRQQIKAADNLYASQITTAGRALEIAGGQSRLQDLLSLTRPKSGETDRRGWEWFYLNTPRESGVETLLTDMTDVHAAQFSPDGKKLAYAGDNGTITIRDMRAGKDLLTISAHNGRILRLAWSPDGKELASGGFDTSIKIWDPETGLERNALTGFSRGVFSLGWFPDGTRLATGDFASNAYIWDTRSGDLLHTLTKHTGTAHANSWSPDGKTLLTSSRDGTIILWNAETGEEIETLEGHDGEIGVAFFSPDGLQIASADENGNIKLWDARTRNELDVHFQGHSDVVMALAWHPDGKSFATASYDGTAVVWDAKTGQAIQTLSGHTDRVWGIDWDPTGERLATSSRDGTVKLWNLNELTDVLAIPAHQGNANVVAYSPDGNWMASAGGLLNKPQTIVIRNVQTGESLPPLTGHTSGINSLSFSPNSKWLVSAGKGDGALLIWDVEGGRELARRIDSIRPYQHAAWSPDGKTLASAAGNRGSRRQISPHPVIIWNIDDVTNPTKRHTLQGHIGDIFFLAFSPDGKRLASAGYDGFNGDEEARILIWDPVQGGKPISKLPGPLEEINSLAWHPDGSRLASAVSSNQPIGNTLGFVRIYDAEKQEELFSLKNHTDGVNSVAWNSDGTRLISGSNDRTIRLWNPQTGTELLTINSPSVVNSVAFGSDDMQIASADDDGNIRIYDAVDGYMRDRSEKMLDYLALKETAGTATTRNFLTRAEIRSQQLQWDKAPIDYRRAAELMGENKPGWFISPWWVIGPYPGDDVANVYAPEEKLGSIDIAELFPIADGETNLRWQQAEMRRNSGLDFARYFDPPEKRTCYAYCRIYGLSDQEIGLLFGADDTHQLWLNGELVHEDRRVGPASSRDHVKLISLKEGWNSVLVKVCNMVGAHQMSLQLSDDPVVLADAFERSRKQQPDWQASLQLWDRALERQPNNPYLLNRHSRAAQNLGDSKKALADLTLLVKNHPDNVPLLLDRARLLKLQSSWVEALSDIQAAVKLQPSNLELQLELGTLYARNGVKTQTAGSAASGKTTELLPLKHPVAFLGRGVAYAEMGRPKLADADISRALKELELKENSGFEITQVLNKVADRYVEKKEIGKAVDLFAQIVTLQPENRDLLIQHANLAARIGRWNEAAESLSPAFELDPSEHILAMQLAPLLLQNRDKAGYQRLRNELLERWGTTDDPMIAERMAKACLLLPAEGEELQTAVDLADLAMAAGPQHSLYRYFQLAKGLAEYRKGDDYEAAVAMLQTCLPKFGNVSLRKYSAMAELLLAMSYQKMNQPDKAQVSFQKAERLILNSVPSLKDGDLGEAYHDVLICWTLRREAAEVVMGPSFRSMLEATDLADLGRDKEALDMLAKIEIPDDNIDFYKTRGGLYLRLNDLKKAANDYDQIAQLEPGKSFHWLKAASLLVAAGDFDRYRQLCTAALDRFGAEEPVNSLEHIVKICSILPQEDTILQQTTQLADEGLGEHPTFEWAKMALMLSEYRRDNFKGAIKWGNECLVISNEKLPNSKNHLNMAAISHLVQAMSYHRLNQPQQAQTALKKGLEVCYAGLPEYPANGWWDTFITHTLRREAEALLNGKPN